MAKKERNYHVTKYILQKYQRYALQNAYDILIDAKYLLEKKRYSRAYFLACSSIEETGKAFMSFSARGHNLNNQGLHNILKNNLENHRQKILFAFSCWVRISNESTESMRCVLEICRYLERGREESMYVDINDDNSITLPSDIVRPIAAEDCIKIAENCYATTKAYTSTNEPDKFTSFHDKLFCLKNEKMKTLFNAANFWEYLLAQVEKDGQNIDFAKCIVTYHDLFLGKGKEYNEKTT